MIQTVIKTFLATCDNCGTQMLISQTNEMISPIQTLSGDAGWGVATNAHGTFILTCPTCLKNRPESTIAHPNQIPKKKGKHK